MKSGKTITICAVPIGREKPIICSIKDGVITRIKENSKGNSIDMGNEETIIAPLLFDIQVNGGFGISVQDENLTEDKLLKLSEKLFQLGIVRWVPTIVSNSIEKTEFLCEVIGNSLKKNKELSFFIPGIHLEGPWISPEEGPRGAHAKEYIRPPSVKEFEKYHKLANGKILYVTLAPEVPKAIPFIRYLVSRGVHVSLGHHNASLAIMQSAVEAGATLCTHIGNGIQNYIHRHNNPIWYSLSEDKLSVSVIADGHHLPPIVLKIIARCKKPNNVILVSDATRFMGMPPGV
ncbi:MAG: N-acetylglucosamine-6-phosphate deacetylase, partial [Candidatus Hydrogenedens sp.]